MSLNTDQIPVNKDNCRKTDLYVYIRERSIALVVRSRFLDCVTVFMHISNNAGMWEINFQLVSEWESATVKHLQQKAATLFTR